MPQYGRTTVGASWLRAELWYQGRTITLASTETAVKMSAYLRSQGSATGGVKMALYDYATDAKVAESAELAGFTDTGGGWKDFTFTSSVPAGTYRLFVIGDAVPGGGNTIEVAYDVAGADSSLYYEYAWGIVGGESWPTIATDLTGADNGVYTGNISVYLETSAGGGGSTAPGEHRKEPKRRRVATNRARLLSPQILHVSAAPPPPPPSFPVPRIAMQLNRRKSGRFL